MCHRLSGCVMATRRTDVRALISGAVGLLLIAIGFQNSGIAATIPSGFSETQIVTGLANPTAMAFAPDGRIFVCLQGGQLRVIKDGALLAQPFVALTVDSLGERGLLGVAFDPNFAANQHVYVYYTTTSPATHNRISRFTATGDVAVAGSEMILLELDNLSSASNHNGGALHFDRDGKLFAAVGENANGANSQTLTNLLGKMLRINADGSIPTDNPFYAQTTGRNRAIWALGLRNPFTFAFQAGTGRMFINDVGQNTIEEINDGIVASNYGWPESEGPTSNPSHRGPLYYYFHGSGPFLGCAITGGTFYNPDVGQFPAEYVGTYFFADFCTGWINRFDVDTGTVSTFASGIASPVDLQVGPDGSLYYLARGSGGVLTRISYTPAEAPSITQHPADRTVSAGQPASFSVAASGSGPLSYQWQRDGTNIAGAASTTYTLASASGADNGARFRAVVTNPFGSATSNDALLTVTGNAPPVATITQPAPGTLYTAGSTISYSGTGTDAEDGTLSANAFTWQVDFHHDTHVHPFIAAYSGATGGSFSIPQTGETSPNVWYRIILTITDSAGQSTTVFGDVRPRTVSITLNAQHNGLQLTLDGQPVPEPYTFTAVVGMIRSIGAPSQAVAGWTYTFRAWSDGGAQTHNITVPGTSTTYTARYQRSK
jgi:glucose/arabinose dehydrogenase